ncbi:hypothetical protein SLE2022_361840 [Rubroshorea leprosula]
MDSSSSGCKIQFLLAIQKWVCEATRLEVYTEEHEKLLGNAKRSWTLFEDGNRTYDPIKGKTCHQCRQKTLGHRSCCSKCNMVQGQLGGDCLHLRYGEHFVPECKRMASYWRSLLEDISIRLQVSCTLPH